MGEDCFPGCLPKILPAFLRKKMIMGNMFHKLGLANSPAHFKCFESIRITLPASFRHSTIPAAVML